MNITWKLSITQTNNNLYVVDYTGAINEHCVADILDIPFNKYIKILINHGASNLYHPNYWSYKYYFNNLQNAENALKELESYLIMKKLIT